ncbi:Ribonuclease H-like protein [Dioscorea alata]|uniref:Ribonuclease H-like protein n=1 Tax=Dioscorea alata TaxID=55571 RepID=A0ACB7W2E8_DIOAL|nr:Ribonuclease H-like protein [Dioscorea alata]
MVEGRVSKQSSNKKDPAWKYNYLKDPKDPISVTCIFCDKTTKGGIFRAKLHQVGNSKNVVACKNCPQDVKKKGPMDLVVIKKAEKKCGKLGETSMNDACDKEARAQTIQYIARFFYQVGITFDAANSDSFKMMVEAIGRYGPNLKPPSSHELRVPLLKKELSYTNDLLKGHKEEWAKHGCSIMSDGWTDKRNRTLMNFLINCPIGTMFMESVDASSFMKSEEKTFELLDRFVDHIGEQNVVQVITDNRSNYVLAGKLLEAKRKHLYWTPCVAHCIDLMLEDIGRIPKIKRTIEKAIQLVSFIYNHAGILNMLRKFTKRIELVKYGITRFATSFLTLQRMYNQNRNLRIMFTSESWVQSKWAKDVKGKHVAETILMPTFWNSVVYILKVMGPLIKVLRLVDNERKPAMGYLYEAMDRAKETIMKSFNEDDKMYKEVFKIIDDRWECQLHHPLHAAGHYLNPEFFYGNPKIEFDEEVTNGLYKCIERLIPNTHIQDEIMNELSLYKRAEGQFGNPMAIRARNTKSPCNFFGNSTPNLQQLAIKILSLTCSVVGCERNWSVFENIHTKKRNRLEHQRLRNLVFVKYNQRLKARYDMQDVIDPISLNDIDDCSEWLVGEMGDNVDNERSVEDELAFEGDSLTWDEVARASGVGHPHIFTRSRVESINNGSNSSSKSRIMEQFDSYESDEEIEDYKSSDDENNRIDEEEDGLIELDDD